jgi:DNA-binding GntR family transcriptional regulator
MEKDRFSLIARQPLLVQVADALRSSIESGVIQSGERLLEVDIAEKMGIGRGTLREAMRLLESEGLLKTIPGRGTYVVTLNETDMLEIYSIRLSLEPESVRWAIKNKTEDEIIQLQQICENRDDAISVRDLSQTIELDVLFHRGIWKMSKNSRLEQMLESIIKQNILFLTTNAKLYNNLALGVSDHFEILKAIEDEDEQSAVNFMQNHLNNSKEIVLSFLHQAKVVDKNA